MNEGSAIDKDLMKKALKKQSLDLSSAEMVVRQRPQRELSFAFSKPST